ncbi:MAG: DUF481 domain-containing protein [Deltaproteobacteria bacterium]|nr:DUF481 domain-containing protein [Deltaproteobacteria bacterium]
MLRCSVGYSLLFAGSAAAQTPVDAGAGAKEKPQEKAGAAPVERPEFAQEAQGTLGTLFTAGNVESASGKAGGFYGVRMGDHGLRADVGLGLAALSVDADADPANGFTQINADGSIEDGSPLDNLNTTGFTKLRYDYFLGDFGSVYGAGLAFHDSAVNLAVRLRADVGYRHFLFNVDKHALSAELGAVYTIDNAIFNVENADTNGDGKVSVWGDDTEFEASGGVVGARFAIAYTNALLDNVAFTQGLEAIPNLSFGPDIPVFGNVDAPFEAARNPEGEGDNQLGLGEATLVNSVSTLTVNLMSNLSLGINLTVVFDNGAVARRNAYTNYDVATAIQLGWKFL